MESNWAECLWFISGTSTTSYRADLHFTEIQLGSVFKVYQFFLVFDCKPEVWEPRNRIVSADLHQFDILINFNWQSFTSSSFQFLHISLCSLQMFKQKLTALVSPAVAAATVASVLFTQHLKTSTCRSLRSPRDGVIIVLSAVVFPCGERWS